MVPAGSVTTLLEAVLIGVEEEEATVGVDTVPLLRTRVGREVGMVTEAAKVALGEVETATSFGVETAAPDTVEDLALHADFLVLVEVPFKYGAPEVWTSTRPPEAEAVIVPADAEVIWLVALEIVGLAAAPEEAATPVWFALIAPL